MKSYSKARQVIFKYDDGIESEILAGIVIGKKIICGCCGEVFDIDDDNIIIISDLKWIDISEEIAGDIPLGD